MKVCLCLALLVASALASPTGDARIIGGVDAASHSHPWQASLQYGGRHICGASIISDRWLVTAAHCVDGNSRNLLSVVVAEHDMTANEDPSVSHHISKVIMHENYNDGSGGAFPNDIALLKLSSSINLDSNGTTSVIKLPTVGMDFYANPNCKISGWGRKDDASGNLVEAPVLQELEVDIRSQSECISAWGSNINSGHICVENGNTGACNGDSGGPLSCEVNGEMYLAGAASWVYRGCMMTGYPTVYSRVSYFREWIDEQMSTN